MVNLPLYRSRHLIRSHVKNKLLAVITYPLSYINVIFQLFLSLFYVGPKQGSRRPHETQKRSRGQHWKSENKKNPSICLKNPWFMGKYVWCSLNHGIRVYNHIVTLKKICKILKPETLDGPKWSQQERKIRLSIGSTIIIVFLNFDQGRSVGHLFKQMYAENFTEQ